MKLNLTVKDWLNIPRENRQKLMELFRFSKSGCIEVVDNQVISDGVTERDLEAFNVGAMINFLGKDLSWFNPNLCDELLVLTLNKLYGEKPEVRTSEGVDNTVVGAYEGVNNSSGTKEVNSRRRGRPPKTKSSVS